MKLSKLFNWFNPSLGSFRVKGLIFNAPFIPVANVYFAKDTKFLDACYNDFAKNLADVKPYFRDGARFDQIVAGINDTSTLQDTNAPALIAVAPVYPPSPTVNTYAPGYLSKLAKMVFYDSKDAVRQPYLTGARVNRAKNTIRVSDHGWEDKVKANATRAFMADFVARYEPKYENIQNVRALVPTESNKNITLDEAVDELTDISLNGAKERGARFEHRWQTAPFEKGNYRVVLENLAGAARTGAIILALASKSDLVTEKLNWDIDYAWPATVLFGSYVLEGVVKHVWHRRKLLKQKRPELKFKL